MTLEGMFGVPLDVAATYIILFTIYGAVLEPSGAGRFFIDWAMAAWGARGRGAAPGRTVTLAGFLLGTVSGSGVATTVMLGSVAWPLLRRAGYRPERRRDPVGRRHRRAAVAADARRRGVPHRRVPAGSRTLQVLVMATVPTLLYYLSIFLMIEADARRAQAPSARSDRRVTCVWRARPRSTGITSPRSSRLPCSWSSACRRSAPSSGRRSLAVGAELPPSARPR